MSRASRIGVGNACSTLGQRQLRTIDASNPGRCIITLDLTIASLFLSFDEMGSGVKRDGDGW